MSQKRQQKYIQKQFSSFSEAILHIIPLKKASSFNFSFSSSSPKGAPSSPTSYDDSYLPIETLYDLSSLLRSTIQNLGARLLIHDLLLLLFVESNERSPDFQYIINWIKSRLWIVIFLEDAEILIKFIKLYHPLTNEETTEYDAFTSLVELDPLNLSTDHKQIPKEIWCKETSQFIKERSDLFFWDRAKFNHERKFLGGKFRSFARLASDIFSSNSAKVSPAPTSEFNPPLITKDEMISRTVTPKPQHQLQSQSQSQSPSQRHQQQRHFDEKEEDEFHSFHFKQQQSIFESNTSWIERARSDSNSIKRQRSLSSPEHMKHLISCDTNDLQHATSAADCCGGGGGGGGGNGNKGAAAGSSSSPSSEGAGRGGVEKGRSIDRIIETQIESTTSLTGAYSPNRISSIKGTGMMLEELS